MDEKTLEKYLTVKTGQDMIDLGIVPKTSSQHISLITKLRLNAIKNKIASQTDDSMFGSWIPAIAKQTQEIGPVVSDATQIIQLARDGFKVIGTKGDYNGIEGIIKSVNTSREQITVEFNKQVKNGYDVNGTCKDGYGFVLEPNALNLVLPKKIEQILGYSLAENVVADKTQGHIILFNEDCKCSMRDSRGGNGEDIVFPKGTKGQLVSYKGKENKSLIQLKATMPNGKNISGYFTLNEIANYLMASSLGTQEPLNKEKEIKKQTLLEFFPKTVFEEERSERAIIAMLLGKDMTFYGLPGGGKTNVAKDIVDIAKQIGIIFTVDECKVNCNPYSLFDSEFAKVVPPCPECMIKYDPNYRQTGFFKLPKANDVKVSIHKFTSGFGVEYVGGSSSTNRMHLVGYKLPKLEKEQDGKTSVETVIEDESDPKGMKYGKLPRTNNGILHADELDKIPPKTHDSLLDALNSNTVHPDELRFSVPSSNLIVATANDITVFSEALRDRMFFMAIRYPEKEETSYMITRRSYHGESIAAEDYEIENTHGLKSDVIRSIPMPTIVERAVDALYMQFRNEYKDKGRNDILSGNRSKIDALDISRAKLLVDNLFFNESIKYASADYAIKGIQFAMCARVTETSEQDGKDSKTAINTWVASKFPEVLKQAENVWWCNAYKRIAQMKTQISEIEANCINELAQYDKNIDNAYTSFQKIKQAYDLPQNKSQSISKEVQLARIEFPFMDYLFNEQPRFANVNKEQFFGMMSYFMKSRENTTCKIGETSEE